jgi:hypothetical protein
MVAFNKFNSFVEALAHKKHNLATDQLKVALCAAANAPVAGNSVLTDLTQISYTNLSTRNITTTSSGQTSGTYKLVLTDLALSASGGNVGPFRYVVIYNDTATNDELIGWSDYGADVTLVNGGDPFTLNFSEANGVLQLV